MTFSDEQLRDYLAGRLHADLAAQLEQAIAQDQDLEGRLLALDQADSAKMRCAIQEMPISDRLAPIEAGLATFQPPAPPSRSRWPGAIAAAAVAAVVVLGMVMINRPIEAVADRWQEQVAIYQALYVTDTLAVVKANPGAVTRQLARGAELLGRPLPLDVVGDLDGLQLLRSQVLGFEGTPLIQMAYLSEDGAPVALCAIKIGDKTQGIVSEALAGLQTVHWSDGTYSYMIVGDIAQDRLLKMADEMQGLL